MTKESDDATDALNAKLGLTVKLAKPSRAIQIRKAAPLPKPGSHAALIRRLFRKKDHHADTG
jgi:hypothetical protein